MKSKTDNYTKWYQNWWFPVIPIFGITDGDYNNNTYLVFRWLCFFAYTSDYFIFSLQFHLYYMGNIGVSIRLPYFYLGFMFTLPDRLNRNIELLTKTKTPNEREHEKRIKSIKKKVASSLTNN